MDEVSVTELILIYKYAYLMIVCVLARVTSLSTYTTELKVESSKNGHIVLNTHGMRALVWLRTGGLADMSTM